MTFRVTFGEMRKFSRILLVVFAAGGGILSSARNFPLFAAENGTVGADSPITVTPIMPDGEAIESKKESDGKEAENAQNGEKESRGADGEISPQVTVVTETPDGASTPAEATAEASPAPPAENVPVLERYEFLEEKMAVPVRLIFYTDSKEKADAARSAVYARFDELNQIMSDYNPESELVRACRQSGETSRAVQISEELFTVLKASRRFYQLTGGAFDISVSPVVKLWRRSRSFHQRPPEPYLTEAKNLVGQENWELIDGRVSGRITEGVIGQKAERHALRLLRKDVRLDLGGIAKGYAIDEGFRILCDEFGIRSALVDAGGDMRVGNAPPDKSGWTVGVASLSDETGAAFYMTAENVAMATSGDTFQFIEIDGVRYSHIIDPRSGEPLTRRSVVTVLAPTAVVADALASGVSVLGPEEGIKLVDSLDGVETIIFQATDSENSVSTAAVAGVDVTDDTDSSVGISKTEQGEETDGTAESRKNEAPRVFATGRFIQIKDDLLADQKKE